MIVGKITTVALVSLAVFFTSCGESNSSNEHDSHNHATETTQTVTHADNRNENARLPDGQGELVDASGEIITGCPMHKEMIGVKGDKCPKCNYMEMVPVTWSLEGIDTVRVTNLPAYNPPIN